MWRKWVCKTLLKAIKMKAIKTAGLENPAVIQTL